ncbi:hypothetical protein A5658_04710 [Mycobacterium sp. 1245111.1]|nr:hypothetical protein A5658_04710 [Mycobacterium sp. 1245111.1]
MEKTWAVGDLVQLDYEYKIQNNPALFRIRSIVHGIATLGQLSTDSDEYLGVDTTVAVDDPDDCRFSNKVATSHSIGHSVANWPIW